MSRRYKMMLLAALVLAVSLPYVLGFALAGSEWVFSGFLLNPIDGQTYLAKMVQGWQGAWRFTLPYTAEPGQGAYIYLNYLALGHLARVLGLPLVLVYHLARLAGTAVMATGLIRLYEESLPPGVQKTALLLSLFGAGMGWLVVFFGLLPSDLWVAEMYPFLSAYTNPHFPLGLGVLVWILALCLRAERSGTNSVLARCLLLAGLSLLLAGIQPFGVVVLVVVLGDWLAWEWAAARRLPPERTLAAAAAVAPGGLYLLYQYAAIQADPLLAAWNAQNVTPAPAVWDFVLSLSPALILAAFAIGQIVRAGRTSEPAVGGAAGVEGAAIRAPLGSGLRLLLVWAAGGLLLAYLPVPFQRRFLLGYYVPLAGLAALGLAELARRWPERARLLRRLMLGLSLPTNGVILLLGLFGMLSHAPELYMTRDEAAVLGWLRAHTAPDALVLAGPEMGLYVPSQSGRRVIYGHPFETINATEAEAAVLAVYTGEVRGAALEAFLTERGVDWILYGEREQALGGTPDFLTYPLAFESGASRVYDASGLP